MKRYEEYKDSGNITILDIPSHWESIKMKYCFHQRSEKGFTDEQPLCSTQSQGVIPQSMYDNRVVVVNTGLENQKLVKVGDFVISLRSFQGGIEYAYYQGVISAAYTILTPKDVRNSEYFKYLFKAFPFIKTLQLCVTGIREGQNINYAELGKRNIPLPPLSEQQAIVSFLDTKTSQIDTYIAGKEKEIDLLKSTKQRIIADAVTKGITPGVEMKEINNICLGTIPSHWKVMRYGTLFKLKPVKEHHGEELLSVFLNQGVIRAAESDKRTHAASEDLSKYQLVEPTDFVMNNQQAWRGSVGVSKLTGIISPAYHIFKMPSCLNPDYANFLLRSKAIVGQFEMSSRGVGSIQRTLNFNWLNNSLVPVPPLSEQQSIVAFIKEKTEAIDSAIEKLENQIELMKKYKQRLISDVVTGQIKVC